MLHSSPDMPQHLVLALDHHRQLREDARRYHHRLAAEQLIAKRPVRGVALLWRSMRVHVGELLIHTGRRIKPDPGDISTTISSDVVWG